MGVLNLACVRGRGPILVDESQKGGPINYATPNQLDVAPLN